MLWPRMDLNPPSQVRAAPCELGILQLTFIREHLLRRHRRPRHSCKRCGVPFDDESSLGNHQRSVRPCPLRDVQIAEGFDETQESLLRTRSRGATKGANIQRWRQVYAILFPDTLDDDIPSPCKSNSLFWTLYFCSARPKLTP